MLWESIVLESTWPEHMVDLPICCSEHDVSMCFNEHGGTPLMSWRSWPEPASRFGFIGCELVDKDDPLGAKPCLGSCRVDKLWSWMLWTSSFRIFPFLLREVICIGILPLSLGFREIPSCPSWYLIKGRFPFILRQDKSLGLEAGGRTQTRGRGPRPGGGDPDPVAGTQTKGRGPRPGAGAGTQTRGQGPGSRRGGGTRDLKAGGGNQGPGGRNLEVGSWRCTYARSERIHSLIGDVWSGEWAVILGLIQTRGLNQIDLQTCFNGHVVGLSEDGHVDDLVNAPREDIAVAQDQVEPTFFFSFIRMRRCPYDGDWSELAKKAGNVCIKGDASAHTQDACASPIAILGLSSSRTSVCSLNRVEECMGQDPGILRGRILATLRIKGMRRLGGRNWGSSCLCLLALLAPLELVKSVINFHSGLRTGLLIAFSILMLLELLASSRDCTLTFGRGNIQHVLLDNLVDSWYQSRILGHVVCGRLQSMLGWPCVVLSWNLEDHGHVFPESEDLEILCMDFSPRNPETGWTFVLEPGGWMNFYPGTRRLTQTLGSPIREHSGSPIREHSGSPLEPSSLPRNGKLPIRRTFHISDYGRVYPNGTDP
ncbi:LOW QUALITY PROTEIN: hypothetical protein HID58_048063 [Brassica napus]|uniref:Uncharacterized protein n=1 Tax=Brassica napus TaxID=3708 RepID=A0ABQ8B2M0_BRANA|nr:LOW QUALITY PROTEIN: hypothetical protein HID58_048063 [Brassica napus]